MTRVNNRSSMNLKKKPSPPTAKKRSPTKANRAASNTRPLSFYFTSTPTKSTPPSASKSQSSSQPPKAVDENSRHRLAALNPNITLKNTGAHCNGQSNNSPLSPKRSVDASPTSSPHNQPPEPKKRKTQGLFETPILRKSRPSGLAAAVGENTATKHKNTLASENKAQDSENKDPSSHPAKTPGERTIVENPLRNDTISNDNDVSMSENSPMHHATNHREDENGEEKSMHDSEKKDPSSQPQPQPTSPPIGANNGNTNPLKSADEAHMPNKKGQLTKHDLEEGRKNDEHKGQTEVRLGLVRVEKAVATLQDLCLTISDPSCNQTRKVFLISSGNILGRNDASSSKAKPNKVLLDIPNKELGVSRKQVHVKTIHSPQDASMKPGTINAKSRTGRLSNYLHKKQLSCPTVEIMCATDAVNPIQIVESRAMSQQTITPEKMVSNKSCFLLKGQSRVLKVGDAIEFDAYNRRTSGVSSGSKMKSPSTPIPSDVKHVFRVVAIETTGACNHNVDEDVEIQKTAEIPSPNTRCAANDLTTEMDVEMEVIQKPLPPKKVKVKRENNDAGARKVRPKSVRISKRKKEAEEAADSKSTAANGARTTRSGRQVKKDPPSEIHHSKQISKGKRKSSHQPTVTPKVGELFTTQWSSKELFLKKKIRKPFIGTATDVKGTSAGDFQIRIEYGDLTVSNFKFPGKDIQRILPEMNRKDGSIYNTDGSKDSCTFAFDANPSDLAVGDHVECLFQNGTKDGKRENRWFAGRVGAVYKDENTIDVAYFDGGYEENIPLRMRKVRLIERGSYQANKWLVGALLPATTAGTGSTSSRTKITGVFSKQAKDGDLHPGKDYSDELFCKISGKYVTRQEIPYSDVLQLLFLELRASCEERKKLHVWPGSKPHKKAPHNDESKAKLLKKLLNGGEEIKTPQVGDHVRVLYKQNGMFSGTTEELWAIAKVLEVKKISGQRYTLNIRYSDNQEDLVEWPDKDVERIIRRGDANSSVFETLDGSDPRGSFACDKNPSDLMVGDYVECLHQNGKFNGRWYAGRVASTSDDGERIDVAYFDGEYEKNIPLRKGVICLIGKGAQNANAWLVGAEFIENTANENNDEKRSKVLRVNTKHRLNNNISSPPDMGDFDGLSCTVKKCDGSEEDVPYNDILEKLFSEKLKNTLNVRYWPNFDGSTLPCEEYDMSLGSSLINPFESSNADEDDLVNMSQDSFLDFSFCGYGEATGPQHAHLNSALGNACWRAFESTEPFNAYGMLVHMEASLNFFPNNQLAENMSVFLEKGPQSEDIQIREPFRIELVTKYMERVVLKSREMDAKRRTHICPTSFSQLEKLLSLPLNIADQTHLDLMTPYQIRCMSQSLHHSARSLNFVSGSVEKELSDVIGDHNKAHPPNLNDKPFTALLWKNDLLCDVGIRSSLKNIVQKAVKCLLVHGHWLVGYPSQPCCTSPMGVDGQQCVVEAKKCFKALCQLVCHASWLFCAKEQIPFAHNDCCFLIRDALNAELSTFDYSSLSNGRKISVKAKRDYQRDITLQFILFLETEFSEILQVHLSNLLDVSNEVFLTLGLH